jgi:hypothetical protein
MHICPQVPKHSIVLANGVVFGGGYNEGDVHFCWLKGLRVDHI